MQINKRSKKYKKKYNHKISNMKSEEDKVELRIVSSNQPLPGAIPVKPTLEDAFLYYFGEKAGSGDVKI